MPMQVPFLFKYAIDTLTADPLGHAGTHAADSAAGTALLNELQDAHPD